MDKFDKNFHNVDPATGRPFSSGHPDGVWIISIIYAIIALASLGTVAFGLIQFMSNQDNAAASIVAGTINLAIYGSIIFFLFRRSTIALSINYIVTIVLGLLAIASFYNNIEAKFLLLAIFMSHVYITHYMYGLVNDKLLGVSD